MIRPGGVRGAFIIAAAVWAAAWASPASSRRPALIILIRHAEEPADPNDPHLSRAGVERAKQLAALITADSMMARLGRPAAVFATRPTKDGDGQRTRETVEPLARKLGLPVRTPFSARKYAALAHLILNEPAYAGKTVLVCWNHTEIPQLAAALGVTPAPPKWKADVYDRVYLIAYSQGRARLRVTRYGNERLAKAT